MPSSAPRRPAKLCGSISGFANRSAEIVLIPAQMGPKLSMLGDLRWVKLRGRAAFMARCRIAACRLWPQRTEALNFSCACDTKRRLLRG
jgi:hypothetical protein